MATPLLNVRSARGLIVALIALATVGCTSAPIPAATPSSTATFPVASEPRPTASGTAASPDQASPEPTNSTTESERSTLFWEALTGGDWGSDFKTLNEVVSDADLVVVGNVSSVRFGEYVGGWEVARATVEVTEVLKGEPESETAGTITIQTVPPRDRESVAANMPTHRNLLFLWYAPLMLKREGQSPAEQAGERYDYILMNSEQGLIRDLDGKATALDSRNAERFPATLDGKSFDDVVDQARRLAER